MAEQNPQSKQGYDLLLGTSIDFRKSDFNKAVCTVKVVDFLGKGCFAQVYKVVNPSTSRVFALKRVKLDQRYGSREKQVLQELQEQGALCLLRVHGFTEQTEANQTFQYFLCDIYQESLFEFVKSGGLQQMIQLPDAKLRIKLILWQILRGVCGMHAHQVMHRDINCQNILLNPETLQVVVADLGCAKKVSRDKCTCYIGQRHYRSPEQFFGSENYGLSVDIYAFGVLAFRLLSDGDGLFQSTTADQHRVELFELLGQPKHSDISSMGVNFSQIDQQSMKMVGSGKLKQIIGHLNESEQQLILACVNWAPTKRLSCFQLLLCNYFAEIRTMKGPYKQLKARHIRPAEAKAMRAAGVPLDWAYEEN